MRTLLLVIALVACKSDKPAPSQEAPAGSAGSATGSATAGSAATGSAAIEGFARECTAATDCIVVRTDTCNPCGCPDQAISSKAMAAFDEAQANKTCPPAEYGVKCNACEPKIAACEGGVCVAKPRP